MRRETWEILEDQEWLATVEEAEERQLAAEMEYISTPCEECGAEGHSCDCAYSAMYARLGE